jgi:hypothetical protein
MKPDTSHVTPLLEAMPSDELELKMATLSAEVAKIPAAIAQLGVDIDAYQKDMAKCQFLAPMDSAYSIQVLKLESLIETAQQERRTYRDSRDSISALIKAIQDILNFRVANETYRATMFCRANWQQQAITVFEQAKTSLAEALALHCLLSATHPATYQVETFVSAVLKADVLKDAEAMVYESKRSAVETLRAHEAKVAAFQTQAAANKAARLTTTTTEGH